MGGLLILERATGSEKIDKGVDFSTIQGKQAKRILVSSEALNCISDDLLYLLQYYTNLGAVLYTVLFLDYCDY